MANGKEILRKILLYIGTPLVIAWIVNASFLIPIRQFVGYAGGEPSGLFTLESSGEQEALVGFLLGFCFLYPLMAQIGHMRRWPFIISMLLLMVSMLGLGLIRFALAYSAVGAGLGYLIFKSRNQRRSA